MKQNDIVPSLGSRHKRKRVGRGLGSGHGCYSGRGNKGQKARSGRGIRLGFEGGQLPLIKRLPQKRGFVNIFKIKYNIVNVGKLGIFAPGSEVSPQKLREAGLIKSLKQPVKILGSGVISVPLLVKAHKLTVTAREKIESVGGKVEEL